MRRAFRCGWRRTWVRISLKAQVLKILLRCNAISLGKTFLTFRRITVLPFSGSSRRIREQNALPQRYYRKHTKKIKFLEREIKITFKKKIKIRGKSAIIHFITLRLLVSYLKYTKIKLYSVILTVMCGWETWSLALKEKQRMRVSAKGLLIKIFVAETEGKTGGYRKLHHKEHHIGSSSRNITELLRR